METNSRYAGLTPFIMNFAQEIPSAISKADCRYDPERQLSQILIDGVWRDSADCLNEALWRSTLVTMVAAETRDDR
jgi:hypothetical protein